MSDDTPNVSGPTVIQLNGVNKPMALHAIAQPLVDDLTRLVIHLGRLFSVTSDEVPESLRDLYTEAIACQVFPAHTSPASNPEEG